MSDSSVTVTTRQAAEILNVHESSIKRWCSIDKLAYSQTPGGHRRILLSDLLAFASAENIDTHLLRFDTFAEKVWQGECLASKQRKFEALVQLATHWIQYGEDVYLLELIHYLYKQEYTIQVLVDRLLAPIMQEVGKAYLKGQLSIGEEHRITYQMRDILIHLRGLLQLGRNRNKSNSTQKHYRAILGCARSQEHELGALMARLVLESMGWDVVYLGLDVPTEEFARQQVAYDATMICIALMPPINRSEVVHIIELLDYMYDRKHPYRLVFGGPISLDIDEASSSYTLPVIKHFKAMSEFSEWVAQCMTENNPLEFHAISRERSSNSLNRSFL